MTAETTIALSNISLASDSKSNEDFNLILIQHRKVSFKKSYSFCSNFELFCQKGKHVISYPRKLVCYCRYDIHFIANVHIYQNIFKSITPDFGS